MEEPVITEPNPSGLGSDHLLDGRYRATEEIGRGSMGVVYVAEHTRLDRRVAIKVLRTDLAEDEEACERFELEARAASRVGSPHIVDVLDAGTLDDGRRFLVMEYLRGETFKAWLERMAPVAPERLAPLMVQLCEGLAAAHDQGIVHRDVKPDNLFLVKRAGAEPLLKILDFGVSKFRDHGTDALRSRTGIVLGTPHYMAPEQARGEREVDRRADLYSVGIVMYQALTGERPFSAENVNQLLFRVALEDVPRVDEVVTTVPATLADVVVKATARDPDQRYPSARLLARDLQRFIDGEQPPTATLSEPSATAVTDLDAPTVDEEVETRETAPPTAPPAAATRRTWWAVGALALALAGVAWMVGTSGPEPTDTETSEEPSVARGEAPPKTLPAPTTELPAPATELEPATSVTGVAPVASDPPATTSPPIARPRKPSPASKPPATKPPPTAKTPRPIREAL